MLNEEINTAMSSIQAAGYDCDHCYDIKSWVNEVRLPYILAKRDKNGVIKRVTWPFKESFQESCKFCSQGG